MGKSAYLSNTQNTSSSFVFIEQSEVSYVPNSVSLWSEYPWESNSLYNSVRINKIQKNWMNAESKLLEIEELDENWDGDDAIAPSQDIVKSVYQFLSLLKEDKTLYNNPPARILPTIEGGILIEWQINSSYYEVEVEEPYKAEYMSVSENDDVYHAELKWEPFSENKEPYKAEYRFASKNDNEYCTELKRGLRFENMPDSLGEAWLSR